MITPQGEWDGRWVLPQQDTYMIERKFEKRDRIVSKSVRKKPLCSLWKEIRPETDVVFRAIPNLEATSNERSKFETRDALIQSGLLLSSPEDRMYPFYIIIKKGSLIVSKVDWDVARRDLESRPSRSEIYCVHFHVEQENKSQGNFEECEEQPTNKILAIREAPLGTPEDVGGTILDKSLTRRD